MIRLLLLSLLVLGFSNIQGQLNMEFRSSIDYGEEANDIWGYTDSNGREYAIVGLRTGVSIIDVTDPDNLVDLGKADGPASTWRDMKTWGTYAYCITEDGDQGILIIDLSKLPAAITTDDWYYVKPTTATDQIIEQAHNIFIDEFGFAYVSAPQEGNGTRINNGGVLIYDLKPTPGQMAYVGQTPPVYAHDAFVVDNKLYTSDIFVGEFSIYDVTDKSNLVLLGTQETESAFTHNVWMSDDGTIAFTTDERPNAPVGAYDVSDPTDIINLDQFRPLETLGEGVIPHNTHVWNDYLIISYYSDGCILVDASEPDHLIEVGNFDTYIPQNQGFNGAWGAYPYLPSQTILVSDIGSGLYVLTPTYKRAARLRGTVVDAITAAPINGAEVVISSTQTNFEFSNFEGKYKTGLADGGTYDVTFSKFGYVSKTISLDLVNGEILDIVTELQPLAAITGTVVADTNGNPIPFAQIQITDSGDNAVNIESDSEGNFALSGFVPGDYTVIVGAWGFKYYTEVLNINDGDVVSYELEAGYEDNFALDLGWEVGGDASTGQWEIGEPVGTDFNGSLANPEVDLQDDLSDKAYVTGNGGGDGGTDDIDGGSTILTTPNIDLTGSNEPILNFSYWWFNDGGQGTPNDDIIVSILENGNTFDVATFNINTQWTAESIILKDFIDATGIIQVVFTAVDRGQGHIAEAAIDGFSITDTPSQTYPDFTLENTSGCVPLLVNLTDNSDSTSAWNWTVTNGTNTFTSTEQNPVVEITSAGTYSVTLVATGNSGAEYIVNQMNAVVALDIPQITMFTFTPDNGAVTFSANATNATSYFWDFGDGNTSTLENPTNTYADGELYFVSLTITNSCGEQTVTQEIFTGLTGTNDINSGEFLSFYPNPFERQLNLRYDFSTLENGSMRLLDVQGQVIDQYTLNGKSGTLNVGTELGAGIYFLQVLDNEKAYQPTRIIKISQ